MDPLPLPSPHLDPATAAGQVSLRFDRWFAEHHLDLPPETRAQFVEMGMDALQRWPERSSGDVLDELIAELDARLGQIVDETAATARTTHVSERPRGLGRLFGRRRDRPH